jgi:hypothetical protein
MVSIVTPPVLGDGLSADQRRSLLARLAPTTLTQADVAAYAYTSPSTVAAARKADQFPGAYRVGQGPWRHFRDEVDSWIQRGMPTEVRHEH